MAQDDSDDPSDLDALIRRVDPDRWMASRFVADPLARADIVALYAFNDELARVATAVTNPLMGEIRFAWWSEALDEIYDGRPVRRQPVTEALAEAVRRRGLARDRLDAMIRARHADLDAVPFADEAALDAYIDATAGALMALAAEVLGARSPPPPGVARAWAIAGLARSHWLGAAPNRLPQDWTAEQVREAVDRRLAEAGATLRSLAVAAFPAVAYATLARPYARRREPGALSRQARILWAVLTGRL